jgi:cyclin-A
MIAEQRDHSYSVFGATYLKYRKVVAEWMIDVCEYFLLDITTTHAAIAYLDRLQPNEKFSRFEWQMLAISCILIASKYNECESAVPDLSTLEEITQQRITNDTLLNYELWALKQMHWKLNARTPISFLATYFVGGLVSSTDTFDLNQQENQDTDMNEDRDDRLEIEKLVHGQAKQIAQNCMLDNSFKHFLASDLAAAIAYIARYRCQISPVWNSTMTQHVGDVNKASIKEIIDLLIDRGDLSIINTNKQAKNSFGLRGSKDKQQNASPTGVDDLDSPTNSYHNNNTNDGKENVSPNAGFEHLQDYYS